MARRKPPTRKPASAHGYCSYCHRHISLKEGSGEAYKHKPTLYQSGLYDVCPGQLQPTLAARPEKGAESQFKVDLRKGLWELDKTLGLQVYVGPLPRPASSKAGPSDGTAEQPETEAPTPAPKARAKADPEVDALRKEAETLIVAMRDGGKTEFSRDEVMTIAMGLASYPRGEARNAAVKVMGAGREMNARGETIAYVDKDGERLFSEGDLLAETSALRNQLDDVEERAVELEKELEELKSKAPEAVDDKEFEQRVAEEVDRQLAELTDDDISAQLLEARRQIAELSAQPAESPNGLYLDPATVVEMVLVAAGKRAPVE